MQPGHRKVGNVVGKERSSPFSYIMNDDDISFLEKNKILLWFKRKISPFLGRLLGRVTCPRITWCVHDETLHHTHSPWNIFYSVVVILFCFHGVWITGVRSRRSTKFQRRQQFPFSFRIHFSPFFSCVCVWGDIKIPCGRGLGDFRTFIYIGHASPTWEKPFDLGS